MLGFKFWKIQGQSMAPVFDHGCFVLLHCWWRHKFIRPGQHLVFEHEQYGYMLKTVAFVDGQGRVWCRGVNSLSLSLAQIGPIEPEQIVGRVIFAVRPPRAARQAKF